MNKGLKICVVFMAIANLVHGYDNSPDEKSLQKHTTNDISSGSRLSQNEATVVDLHGIKTERLTMPEGFKHPVDDDLCLTSRLIEDQFYVVGYKPELQSKSIDRIVLYGWLQHVQEQRYIENAWNCSLKKIKAMEYFPGAVLYEWTREDCGEDISFPELPITVGGPLGFKHFVLVVHYARGGSTDTSGLTVKLLPYSYSLNTTLKETAANYEDYYSKTFSSNCGTTSSPGDDQSRFEDLYKSVVDRPGIKTERLTMPEGFKHQGDDDLCLTSRLIEDQFYVVGYKPEPQSKSIDRIVLVGCLQFFDSNETAWNCSLKKITDDCSGVVIYNWTREGCEHNFFSELPILVGGGNPELWLIRNLVLMVHYAKGGSTDTSGLTLKLLPITYSLNTTLKETAANYVDYYSKTFSSRSSRKINCGTTSSPGDDQSRFEDLYKYGIDEGGLEIVNRWPSRKIKLGQVSGVDTDKEGRVYLFQRADRMWKQGGQQQPEDFHEPITNRTVITLDPRTGTVIGAWGSNKFYMPHGLTVDDGGNVWLTDVVLHQVFKFPPGQSHPSLVLGTEFTPGEDYQHFCKPTDVAVESRTGNFFVADGYCNSRVLKYSENGTFLMEITAHSTNMEQPSSLNSFQIPHSLALAERRQLLCVADRENGRIQCFNSTTGAFVKEIARQEFAGSVYAITYDDSKDVLYAITGRTDDPWDPTQGFTLDIEDGTILDVWQSPCDGFGDTHDVAVYSPDGSVYVADIGVWKFEEMAIQDNAF